MRLLLIILFLPFIGLSQDFEFTNVDELVTSGLAVENETAVLLNAKADVKNLTTEDLTVFSRYEIISTTVAEPDSMSYSFCWVGCYGSTTIESPFSHTMAPNQEILGDFVDNVQGFKGTYRSNQHGTTLVRQTFYDESGNYESHIDITFCVTAPGDQAGCTVSIDEQQPSASFMGNLYPNPSSTGSVNLDFSVENKSAVLTIINLMGEEIKKVILNDKEGSVEIDTSSLESGVYFISLEDNSGFKSTKKLIIE